jgi:hypothetical protein
MHPVVNLFEYERLAKARMTLMAFDYYASGARFLFLVVRKFRMIS